MKCQATIFVPLLALVVFPSLIMAESAKEVLEISGVNGGLVVCVGAEDSEFVMSLRGNDRYLVSSLDDDQKIVDAARKEIDRLWDEVRKKGVTIVPTRVYLKEGRAKVEIAVGRGKRQYDKRHDIAKRDAEREIERNMRRKDY